MMRTPKLLPLDKLGAREIAPGIVEFGLYLPGITQPDFQVSLRILHEKDQFLQQIPPFDFHLQPVINADFPLGDYWMAAVDTNEAPPDRPIEEGSHWSTPGRYIYRYQVTLPDTRPESRLLDFVVDPYCRETGFGDMSAVTIGFKDHEWSQTEAAWKTPALEDMVVYELMINEFGGSIEGTIQQLDYLRDLGVNCIELMPINNVRNAINWGYDPIGFFAIDERFGDRRQFQRLVDEAHQRGIAVIVDVVFGHTTGEFTFPHIYSRQKRVSNPFNGYPIRDNYGPAPDYDLPFTQDFFYTVCQYLLDRFHLDGFRFDNVNGFSANAHDTGPFGRLAEAVYTLAKNEAGRGGTDQQPNYWRRFLGEDQRLNLVLCPEYLEDPARILRDTVANCVWQDRTMDAAKRCALDAPGAISELGRRFALLDFPTSGVHNGATQHKTAFQYIENHDHLRFLCLFGMNQSDNVLLQEADRSHWYRLQPYLIGLLMSKGVPFLFEGEELAESYFVPGGGNGRQLVFRPVRFSYFYDNFGRPLVNKVRRLMKIRHEGEQFRRGDLTFIDAPYYTDAGLLVFTRSLGTKFSMVALNFSGVGRQTTIQLPLAGDYREEIDGQQNLLHVVPNWPIPVNIPSNYGQIWTTG